MLGRFWNVVIVMSSTTAWSLGYQEQESFTGRVVRSGLASKALRMLWFNDKPAVRGWLKLWRFILKVTFSAPWAVGKAETDTSVMLIVGLKLDSVLR